MFFQVLKKLAANGKKPEVNHGLALATLFIQLANTDNDYSSEEHELIITILENRYKIERKEAKKIIEEAKYLERDMSDTMQITREIKNTIPYEERSGVVRDLWQIIMADNKRSNEENNFMRLVIKLLGITDKLSAQIRREVVNSSLAKNKPEETRGE